MSKERNIPLRELNDKSATCRGVRTAVPRWIWRPANSLRCHFSNKTAASWPTGQLPGVGPSLKEADAQSDGRLIYSRYLRHQLCCTRISDVARNVAILVVKGKPILQARHDDQQDEAHDESQHSQTEYYTK